MSTPDSTQNLTGFGGWLWVFGIRTGVLTPFFAATNLVSIGTAKWYLGVDFLVTFLIIFSPIAQPHPGEGIIAVGKFFAALAWMIIWSRYFKVSKRVKATYGPLAT